MKKKVALALIVITVSFSIGYLTYFGTVLFADFLKSQFDSCDKVTHSCVQKEVTPNYK